MSSTEIVARVKVWLRRVDAARPISKFMSQELTDIVTGKTGPLPCPFGCYQTCPDCGDTVHTASGAGCPWARREFEAFGRGHLGLHKLRCRINPRDVLDDK